MGTKESDFVVADPEDEEVINGTDLVNVEPASFVVVANGIGGKSLRDPEQDLLENPWFKELIIFPELDIRFWFQ